MPCNTNHMNPTKKEQHIKEAAILLEIFYKKLNRPIATWISNSANDAYGGYHDHGDRAVHVLCIDMNALNHDNPPLFKQIVYNAYDKQSRRLADWWEEHNEYDKQRFTKLANSIVSKLSDEELEFLGLTRADVMKKVK